MVAFDRPVGAPADVQELEYVSALHQTARIARTDGSINDEDIMYYLRSRFGIEVTLEEVRKTILQGMGGSADDGEVIDLVEMTAILLIPYLNKAAALQRGEVLPEGCVEPSKEVLKHVHQMILHDVFLTKELDDEDAADIKEQQEDLDHYVPKVSAKFIQGILMAYGETALAENDDLVQKMLDQLDGHERFDVNTLAQALTKDVRLYNAADETTYSSIFRDIMGPKEPIKKTKTEYVDATEVSVFQDEEDNDQKPLMAQAVGYGSTLDQAEDGTAQDNYHDEDLPEPPKLVQRYTAPAIDSFAGSYRSKTLFVVLWASVLFNYLALTKTGDSTDTEIETCEPLIPEGSWEENSGRIKCAIADSITDWLEVFFVLCLFGMIWVGCGSLGNVEGNKQVWKPILAILFLAVFTILPNQTSKDEDIDSSERYIRIVAILLGTVAVSLHLLHIFYLCGCSLKMKDALNRYANKAEADLKASGAYKIDRLVQNALEVHHTPDQQNIVKSCFGHALHVFSKWKKRETIGSMTWAWSNIWSAKLFSQEGVWYSPRLKAANLCQYIVALYVGLTFYSLQLWAVENFDKEIARESLRERAQYFMTTHVTKDQIMKVSTQVSAVMSVFLEGLAESDFATFNCTGFVSDRLDFLDSAVASADINSIAAGANATISAGLDVLNDAASSSGLDKIEASLVTDRLEVLNAALSNGKNQISDIITGRIRQQDVCALLHQSLNLDNLDQMALLAGSGLDVESLLGAVNVGLNQTINDGIDSLYPQSLKMVTLPLTVAAIAGSVTSIYLAVSYLPSVTSTILQLRSGVIPLLRNKKLNVYRAAPDTVTLLTGSLFWGCLFSGFLAGIVFGVASFGFVYQGSVVVAQKITIIAVGVGVVTLIRTFIIKVTRMSYFHSFYRKKPAAANIYFLAIEWANFALSAGFVFVRFVTLLLVTICSVGRIDSPFLAKGAGEIGSFELDAYPTVHMRDILATEAHRHPYIELLGTVYLIKMRYGTRFSSNAGSCWRLIFVYALMPWMQKYRIHSSTTTSSDPEEIEAEEEIKEKEPLTRKPMLKTPSRSGSHLSSSNAMALRAENDSLRKQLQDLQELLEKKQSAETGQAKPWWKLGE